MTEVFTHRERAVDAASVLRLFAAEGWWPERTEEVMGRAIAAGPAVGAWSGGELVGFARAVEDGGLRAYIEDVIVAEPHRGVGVAAAMISLLTAELPPGATVSLFCSPGLQQFYARLGFVASGQVVMHRSAGT